MHVKKVGFTTLFMMLITFLPIVDSLNGLLNGGGNDQGLSIGIIYRLVVMITCFCGIFLNGFVIKDSIYYPILIMYFLISLLNTETQTKTYFIILIKLLLPLLLITTGEVLVRTNQITLNMIYRLFDIWKFLFPLTIIIPYMFGGGFSTYGTDAAGVKGFYYAQNDVGYILSLLYLFALFQLRKKTNSMNIIAVLLLLITNLILGLKSNYIFVIVITLVYLLNTEEFKEELIPKIIAIVFILVGGLFVTHHYQDQIQQIITRWQYFYGQRTGLSFWTSARIDRVPLAFQWLLEKRGLLGILLGTGYDYTANTVINMINVVEMDPIDLFFQLGIVGTIMILEFYLNKLLKYKNRSVYTWGFLVSMIYSVFAGHILESALSGMFFSMVCIGMILSKKSLQNDNG